MMTFPFGLYYSPNNVTEEEAETTFSGESISSIDEEEIESIYEPPVTDLPEGFLKPHSTGPDWYDASMDLWMVVEIEKKGFSEKLEYDAELDLILAPESKFLGFAATKARTDEMTTAPPVGVPIRNKIGAVVGEDVVSEHVYITYKASVKGTAELKKLLTFLKEEGMLQSQG